MVTILKFAYETFEKIPESATRFALLVALIFLGLLGVRAEGRMNALERNDIRIEEQRKAEIDAIKELASEVRAYRASMMEMNSSLQNALDGYALDHTRANNDHTRAKKAGGGQ